jgi:histidinol phosphatase-like PHP family hydrolase
MQSTIDNPAAGCKLWAAGFTGICTQGLRDFHVRNMCERCDDELVSVHKLANIIVEILFSVFFMCYLQHMLRAYKRERTERV